MKKTGKFIVIFLAFAAIVMSGCAAKIGGTSIKPTDDKSEMVIKEALAAKVIYYQITYYKAGWLNWNVVTKDPLPALKEDSPEMEKVEYKKVHEFGDLLAQKAGEIFKKDGIKLVRVSDHDQAPAGSLFFEMRVALKGIQPKFALVIKTSHIIALSGGTRWIVSRGKNVIVEIYDYQINPSGYGMKKDPSADVQYLSSELAPRMVKALLDPS